MSAATRSPPCSTRALRGQLQAGTATVATLRAAAGPNAAKDLQTRYVYDAAGQMVFMLDAVGAVTRNWYDAAGRVVASRRYATAVNFAGVTDTTSVATLQALVVENLADQGEYRVYDSADDRLDLAGTLQQIGYDAAGRMTVTRTYATLFLGRHHAARRAACRYYSRSRTSPPSPPPMNRPRARRRWSTTLPVVPATP